MKIRLLALTVIILSLILASLAAANPCLPQAAKYTPMAESP